MRARDHFFLDLFVDRDGAWRVRMRFANGRIAMSSEAYSSSKAAWRALRTMLFLLRAGQPRVRMRIAKK